MRHRLWSLALGSCLSTITCLSTTATRAEDFSSYDEPVPGADKPIAMVSLQGGDVILGSPEDEPGRAPAEGPQHEVSIGDFWIGKYEISWQQYKVFVYRNKDFSKLVSADELAALAIDGVTGASSPYTVNGVGDRELENHPASNLTQHAALSYARWLSAKTGRFYRLPTEAEWEYACRAGTKTPWSFGSAPAAADRYSIYSDNSDGKSAPVGSRSPNPWQLHDMHGNIAEWTMDQYAPGFYAKSATDNPWNRPKTLFPRVARGGSWAHDTQTMRCAARMPSDPGWKASDPQFPRSLWWHTDAPFIGFRLVRPRIQPPAEEIERFWLEAIEDFGD
jgi:formylglycine-generating enzyme required for sulfatase activity